MAGLLSNIRFKILLDEGELQTLAKRIDAAIQKPADRIVAGLASQAVSMLRRLDNRIGHPYLAKKWTYSGPHRAGLSVWTEVYSEAETEAFRNKDAFGKETQHTIKGDDLLRILEGGAKRHEIAAVNAPFLVFRADKGWRKSQFLGTLRGGIPSFLNKRKRQGLGTLIHRRNPRGWLRVETVSHPGVTGNRFVEQTRQMLEDRLEAAAERAFMNIAVE